ncbi:hypothetical protein L0244_32035 [bacterium]|nr:hypothetical protein [bacterium]
MALTELLPELQTLNRADKLRVMQFLVLELAKEEDSLLKSGMPYPVWSPYDAFGAANTLLSLLKVEENSQHA